VRVGLAGKAVALLQFRWREHFTVAGGGVRNGTSDELDFAAITSALSTAYTNQIYAKLMRAFKDRFASWAISPPT
jgi:hypothetical protein